MSKMVDVEVLKMMENVKSTHLKMGMPMQELDAVPDHPSDALRCQMRGKEGKYAKRGEVKSVAKQYESDKGYMEWIRNHINSKSSMEMQRLRIYIYQRDAQKKEQLMRERARDMLSGRQRLEPCESGRNNRPSTPWDASHSGAAERDSGELEEHGEKPLPELKENQMTMHVNSMHPKTPARFMMNMITH